MVVSSSQFLHEAFTTFVHVLADLPSRREHRPKLLLTATSNRGHSTTHQRRLIADAFMLHHGPRGAASTGNIKVAFCQSFSVRSHKGHASYRASMCAVLGAAQWPTAGTACSGMSPTRLQLISVLQLHLLTAHAHNSVNPSALACGRCTVLPLLYECMADS